MKNIYLTLGLIGGLALTSCGDFLDKEPTTSMAVEGAITTADDLQNALNGVGRMLTNDRMSYPSEFGIYADLRSNEFDIIKSNGQSTPLMEYTVTKYDELAEDGYYNFYRAIANANKALETSQELSGDEIKNLQGQLIAWRGLLHFDLARLYAHIPSTVSNMDEPQSGIVIADKYFDPDYTAPRNTLRETYVNEIIKDLGDAYNMLDEDNGVGYMNKWAALALRARAYLYIGDYTNALKDAKEVIEKSGKKLYEIADYANVWGSEGTSESLMELKITSNYNVQRNSMGYYTNPDGYAECGFNEDGKLFKYLSTTPNDVRSELINDFTSHSTAAGYYPAKYPGREGSLYINNPKIIRLSEVYLIAAEAEFYLNGGAAAAPYINSIEEKRVTGYTPVASVTIDDIIWEYTKELFGENQITFAYWRNKQSIVNHVGKTINYDDEQAVLPIPQREIDLNKELKQNEGY